MTFDNVNYRCHVEPSGDSAPYAVQIDTMDRRNRAPVRLGMRPSARQFTLWIQRGSGTTKANFARKIAQVLAPERGERTIYGTHTPSGTAVQITADIPSYHVDPRTVGDLYDITAYTCDPYWQAQTPRTDTINLGDVAAYPVYTITPSGTSVRHRTITITDRTGRGLANYLVLINALDTTGISATGTNNYVVKYKGRSVPFYLQTPNNANSVLAVRVDVPRNSSVTLDLYYGSAINNTTTSQQLDYGQLDLASSSNTDLRFNSTLLATAPTGASQVWTPAKLGQVVDGTSYGLTNDTVPGVIFRVGASGKYQNDADSMLLQLGAPTAGGTGQLVDLHYNFVQPTPASEVQQITWSGAPAEGSFRLEYNGTQSYTLPYNASAAQVRDALYSLPGIGIGNVAVVLITNGYQITFQGALTETAVGPVSIVVVDPVKDGSANVLSATWATTTEGVTAEARFFVRYRLPNQANWTDALSTTTPGSSTTLDVDVPNAAALAIGIEPLVSGAEASLQIDQPLRVLLNSSLTPTVSIGSAATAYYFSSLVLTNSTTSQSITLTEVFMDNTTLVIDTDAGQIYTGNGSLWFRAGLSMVDPDRWLPLAIGGGNTLVTTGSTPASASVAESHRERFAAV